VENFQGVCDPQHSPSPIIPSPCIGRCRSKCCRDMGQSTATCLCDRSKGWNMVDPRDSTNPAKGTCYCDPSPSADSDGSCKNIYTCGEWNSLATSYPEGSTGCSTGTVAKPEKSTLAMTASPQQFCCASPEPNLCSPNPCGQGTCSPSDGDNYTCDCDQGYRFIDGTCSPSSGPNPTCSPGPPNEEDYSDPDTDGINLVDSPPVQSGQTETFTCKSRSGWKDYLWFWKMDPDPVNYQCGSPGNPLLVVGDPDNTTPCNQFSWWWPVIIFILIFGWFILWINWRIKKADDRVWANRALDPARVASSAPPSSSGPPAGGLPRGWVPGLGRDSTGMGLGGGSE
jgi:hypothetical protein